MLQTNSEVNHDDSKKRAFSASNETEQPPNKKQKLNSAPPFYKLSHPTDPDIREVHVSGVGWIHDEDEPLDNIQLGDPPYPNEILRNVQTYYTDMDVCARLSPSQKYLWPAIAKRKSSTVILSDLDDEGITLGILFPVLSRFLQNTADITGKPLMLFIVSTKELALEIKGHLKKILKNEKFRISCATEGKTDLAKLDKLNVQLSSNNCDILIGCASVIQDIFKKGQLDLSEVKYFCVLELDLILQKNEYEFLTCLTNYNNVEKNLWLKYKETQNIFWSTEYSPQFQKAICLFFTEHIFLRIRKEGKETIPFFMTEHSISCIPNEHKKLALKNWLTSSIEPKKRQTIIFVRGTEIAKTISAYLKNLGYTVSFLESHFTSSEIDELFFNFEDEKKQFEILVTTDDAFKTLDNCTDHVEWPSVYHVVHYDLPKSMDIFVKRSQCSGHSSSDRMGIVCTFYEPKYDEQLQKKLIQIVRQLNQSVPDWIRISASIGELPAFSDPLLQLQVKKQGEKDTPIDITGDQIMVKTEPLETISNNANFSDVQVIADPRIRKNESLNKSNNTQPIVSNENIQESQKLNQNSGTTKLDLNADMEDGEINKNVWDLSQDDHNDSTFDNWNSEPNIESNNNSGTEDWKSAFSNSNKEIKNSDRGDSFGSSNSDWGSSVPSNNNESNNDWGSNSNSGNNNESNTDWGGGSANNNKQAEKSNWGTTSNSNWGSDSNNDTSAGWDGGNDSNWNTSSKNDNNSNSDHQWDSSEYNSNTSGPVNDFLQMTEFEPNFQLQNSPRPFAESLSRSTRSWTGRLVKRDKVAAIQITFRDPSHTRNSHVLPNSGSLEVKFVSPLGDFKKDLMDCFRNHVALPLLVSSSNKVSNEPFKEILDYFIQRQVVAITRLPQKSAIFLLPPCPFTYELFGETESAVLEKSFLGILVAPKKAG